ncbi:MAG: GNAT family N-acetyltransferase [Ferrimicrobium sp.]|jgi:ribosomal protein S18 acetylase RimI-like enzyme|nr:GNAT family N-acetyltransferase [Ferrimicrobium sp.]
MVGERGICDRVGGVAHVSASRALLVRIEDYFDQLPRTEADVEAVGPLNLVISRTPFHYPARPAAGGARRIRTRQLRRLERSCVDHRLPIELEWIAELNPELEQVVVRSGWTVTSHPLLIVTRDQLVPRPRSQQVRVVDPHEPALLACRAVIEVAFSRSVSTTAGTRERDRLLDAIDNELAAYVRRRARAGDTVTGAVVAKDRGVLAGGSYRRVGVMAEVVGVGTLPAYRRQGHGLDVVSLLCDHAFERGTEEVLLTAWSQSVAELYGKLGFVRVGTAMVAQLQAPGDG